MRIILALLCLLCLNTSIYAVEQPSSPKSCVQTIMTIDSYEISWGKTTILLSNGLVWKYNDIDLFVEGMGWQIGDRVNIVMATDKGITSTFHLQNVSYQGLAPVELYDFPAGNSATRISNIIPNKEKGTKLIVLDDGSKWFIGKWSCIFTDRWQIGDRVVISPSEKIWGNTDYIIVNFDRNDGSIYSMWANAQFMQNIDKECIVDSNFRKGTDWKLSVTVLWLDGGRQFIELNNGTVWECTKPDGLLGWNSADEIRIGAGEKCILTNLKNRESVTVVLQNKNSDAINCEVIERVESNGKITLSDGTVWNPSPLEDNMKSWKVGDRVIVSTCDSKWIELGRTHTLINLDYYKDRIDSVQTSLLR